MKYLESKNKTIFAVLINVVLCLIISLKITAPLVQPLLTDCVDKPPMEAAFLFMENQEWKPVLGFEEFYEVNRLGVVRTIAGNRLRKNGAFYPVKAKIKVARRTKIGYVQVALVANNITFNTYLHRIIAEAFIDKPEGCNIVNHKNGIKDDNRIENLEWTTSSLNNIHALDNKLRSTRKATTAEFVNSVIHERSKGKTIASIANGFGVKKHVIQGIASGKTYRRLHEDE